MLRMMVERVCMSVIVYVHVCVVLVLGAYICMRAVDVCTATYAMLYTYVCWSVHTHVCNNLLSICATSSYMYTHAFARIHARLAIVP